MSNAALAYILSFVAAATIALGGAAAAEGRLVAQELLGQQVVFARDEVFSRFIAELLLRLPNFLAPAAGTSMLYLTLPQLYQQMTHRPDASFLAPDQMVRRMRQWRRLGYTVMSSPFGKIALLEALHMGPKSVVHQGLYEPGRHGVLKIAIKSTRKSALFKTEERALVSLRHESILPLYFTGTTENAHFMVSELMVGSLTHILKKSFTAVTRGPEASFFTAVRYFKDIVGALAHMHGEGWLHRNISPGNILINKYKRAILADFSRATRTRAMKDDELFGSEHYMAPECFDGYWNQSSDVFAACAVLFRLINGMTFRQHLATEPGMSDRAQHLNWELQWGDSQDSPMLHLLQAGLSLDPRKRPTAAECVQLANEILEAGGEAKVPLDEIELAPEFEIIEHVDADPTLCHDIKNGASRARCTAAKIKKIAKKGFGKLKLALEIGWIWGLFFGTHYWN
ncbi:Maternal embryonic leucine zipper kinase [Vanrija pseudolonga]|uniref:Maternal embryonic leucine zipper kinase n=1 Tax=Vanrija pseudolonga TaxID=143232 RepID=A0AAF0YCT1_9TREE|nr:Maternal embryonic leucine zipper kinase [Vanrija pseudolonga]